MKPIFPPHVSPSIVLKHIEELIREEKANKQRVTQLKNSAERLKDMIKFYKK